MPHPVPGKRHRKFLRLAGELARRVFQDKGNRETRKKMEKITTSYCFAGGGTGGHLFPGIAVAREIRKRDSEARIIFVSTGRRMERQILASIDCEVVEIPSVPFTVKPWKLPEFIWKTVEGIRRSKDLLGRGRVDAVIGLGGYGSVSPAVAARMMGVPLFLLEQNAIPGKANRLAGMWAHSVFVPWEATGRWFSPKVNVVPAGNPTRRLMRASFMKPYSYFGFDRDRKTLLVMGGSQGALGMNMRIHNAIPELAGFSKDIQVIHLTGGKGDASLRDAYRKAGIPAAVIPFSSEMNKVYSVADLAVSRAGGTSIAELTAVGLPAILIPFPAAAHDHQRFNAGEMARTGAALVVEEKNLTPDALRKLIAGTLFSPAALKEMQRTSRSLGRPDAARIIVNHIERTLFREERKLARAG